MRYIALFNALADGSPALPKLIEAAVEGVNGSKPLSIPDWEIKFLVDEFTVTSKKTNEIAVLELDVEKMDKSAKFIGQFRDRLGRLFEGLAERQNVVDGRRITLNLKKAGVPTPASS